MDKAEQRIWTRRLKIELEHNDLVEKRNAFYVLETAVPIGFLTLSIELKVLDAANPNAPYFLMFAAILFFGIHTQFVQRFDERIERNRGELDTLLRTLGARIEKVKPQLVQSDIAIKIWSASALTMIFGAIIESFIVFSFGLFLAVIAALRGSYEQWRTESAKKKTRRKRRKGHA